MEFKDDEKKIKKILDAYSVRKPPDALMKDYEKEVMEKIKVSKPGFPLGLGIALGASLTCLAIAAMLYFVYLAPAKSRGADQNVSKNLEVIVIRPTPTPEPINTPVVEDEDSYYDTLAQDLLLLEMLGEDEGLLDDFELMEVDMEFMSQATPVVA